MSNIFSEIKDDPKPPWDIKETSITDKIFGFITSGACNKQKYNFCSNTLHKRIIIAVSLLLICLFFIFMSIGLHEIRMNKQYEKPKKKKRKTRTRKSFLNIYGSKSRKNKKNLY